MSWGNLTEEDLKRGFKAEYKMAFKDMLENHVRPERQKDFLESVFKATNQNASSTVWGAVLDVAEELFGEEYMKSLVYRLGE